MLSSSLPTLGRLRAVSGTCPPFAGTRITSIGRRIAFPLLMYGVVCASFTLVGLAASTCRSGCSWSSFRGTVSLLLCATSSALKRPLSSSIRSSEKRRVFRSPLSLSVGRARPEMLQFRRTLMIVTWMWDRRPPCQRVPVLEPTSCLLAVQCLGARLCPRRLRARLLLPALFAATRRLRVIWILLPRRPSGLP